MKPPWPNGGLKNTVYSIYSMYHQFSRDEHNFFVGHLSASLHQQTKHESNGLLVLLGQEKGQAITIFCILFDHETFSPDIDDDKKLHCQLGIQPSSFLN